MSIAPETRRTDSPTGQQREAAFKALFEGEPPAMITKSIAAFRRDLPELLKTHGGRWVAYHGDERIGFGRRETPLYQECLRRGLSADEFVVCGIEACAFDPDEDVVARLDV